MSDSGFVITTVNRSRCKLSLDFSNAKQNAAFRRMGDLRRRLEAKYGEKVHRITRGEMVLGYGLRPERLPK